MNKIDVQMQGYFDLFYSVQQSKSLELASDIQMYIV